VCLRCGGEVLHQQGSGFEWGEVSEFGVLAEPGVVVLDLDEAEDIGTSRLVALPYGGADLGFQQSKEALGCSIIVAYILVRPMLCRRLNSLVCVRNSVEVYWADSTSGRNTGSDRRH
jgi:hypothetical protein